MADPGRDCAEYPLIGQQQRSFVVRGFIPSPQINALATEFTAPLTSPRFLSKKE